MEKLKHLTSVLVLFILITVTLTFVMPKLGNDYGIALRRDNKFNIRNAAQFGHRHYTIRSKQDTLYKLAKTISSHDYSTFNHDILVNQHKFHHFSPSKLITVLSNKKIIFFGDSTVYRFYLFIIYCLDFYVQNISADACQFNSTLLNRYYNDWNAQRIHNGTFLNNSVTSLQNNATSPSALSLQYHCAPINATLILFENRWEYKNITQLSSLYKEWAQYRPNLIFWNPSALHLLHLTPMRHFQNLKLTPRFREDLMNIYAISKHIGAVLIYRGTSPLCYSKDGGRYRAVRSVYKRHYEGSNMSVSNYSEYMNVCIRQAMRSKEVSDPKKLCKTWTFMNEGGISYSNRLMKHFVSEIQNGTYGEYKNVFFYDRFNIFHKEEEICGYESSDAAHWLPSYAADAMYFVNTLDLLNR